MSITTILQLYRRPNYLKEQLEAIKKQTVPSTKIIAVHNNGGVKFNYPDELDNVIYSHTNLKYHLRFAIGLLATTEYVVFYDDDTCPNVNWHQNCIDTIKKHDCICGTNGRIVDRQHGTQIGVGWANPNETEIEVDLVGHSWFLKRKNLKYMFYEDIIEHENGEDIQLSANCQRFGNIPTFVPPHPIANKSLWGSNPDTAMKMGCDQVSSWIVNKQHNQQRYDLFDKYAEKGWKLVLE